MRVRSGVDGFDALIEGGFPEGAGVIVQGPSGNEKDSFALQFLADGLRAGEAAVVVISSTSPEQFVASLAKFGVDVETVIALNRLKIVDWHSYQEENVASLEERGHILRCSVDLTNVGIALSRALGTLAADVQRRAVLEVLSRALRIYDVDQVYAFAQSSKAKLARHRVTALFLLEKEMHDAATVSSVCQPFDGVIDIDRRREGDRIVRKIGVLSLKETVPDSRFHPCDMTAGKGLQVLTADTEKGKLHSLTSSVPLGSAQARKGSTGPAPSTPSPDRAALILRIADERIRIDPQDADALFAKASALAAMGNLVGAIEGLDALTRINDTYPGLWVLRAKLFARLGDKQGAQESRRRAEGIALREDQRVRSSETVACPICDAPVAVDALDCSSCGARFVEELGLAEELDRLGKATIQERVKEEFSAEGSLDTPPERREISSAPKRPEKPTSPPSPRTSPGRVGMTNGLGRDGLRGPVGRTNGLTNGMRGRTNGLTNGLRGRTNGLTNGLRGRTNGLTNGLRGRTNGLTNGLVNGLASMRRGMTNGLTNGNGFTNGLGSSRFRRESTVAKWKLYVIPLISVVLLLLPLLAPSSTFGPSYPITIDGNASDWNPAALAPQARGTGINPNVDIVRFGLADNIEYLAFLVEVDGIALRGGVSPPTLDVIRIFVDVDRDAATGYRVDGLGADRMLVISGWQGAVNASSMLEWDASRTPYDWSGWTRATTVTAAASGSRIEAQVEWGSILPEKQAVHATAHGRSFDGTDDIVDYALNSGGASLSVTQESVAPQVIAGSNVQLLRIEMNAFGGDVSVDGITVTLTGSARFDAVTRLSLVDGTGAPVDQRIPVDRRVPFQFTPRQVPVGSVERFFVVAETPVMNGETTGAFLGGPEDIRALNAAVTVRRLPSPLDVGYLGSVPVAPRIDGGFAEWTSAVPDAIGDVSGLPRPDVDFTGFAMQTDGTTTHFFTQVDGRLFAGTWVPELNGLAPSVQTGIADSDRDTVPDTIDPYPFDFNNDEFPDAQTGGDYDGDGVTDYGFIGGTDEWLNTTLPLTLPSPYAGRSVTLYIGPIDEPVRSPDDIVRVFVDLDNMTWTGYSIGGIGADRLIEIAGASGLARSAGFHSFDGSYPGQWSWANLGNVSFALGFDRAEYSVPGDLASSGSPIFVEIGSPLGSRDDLASGTRGGTGAQLAPSQGTRSGSSFDIASSPLPSNFAWSDTSPGTRATLIDSGSNAISTQYNHQRKIVRAGDVAGDGPCDATNSDGCWYAVFSDRLSEETSTTAAGTETITTGTKISGTFPTDISSENGAYIQYREAIEAAGFVTKVGAFNIGTGALGTTVAITGVGFQPKVVIFWWSGRTESVDTTNGANIARGFGVAVSPTDRRAIYSQSDDAAAGGVADTGHHDAEAIGALTTAGAIDGLADLQSMDSGGFTLVIDDVFTINLRVHYLALGGADLTNVATGMFTEPAATGNQDITTVGFQPDGVILFSAMIGADPPGTAVDSTMMIGAAAGATPANAVWAGGSDDVAATTQTVKYTRAGESVALLSSGVTSTTGRASVTQWLSNGFRLNWAERAGSRRIHYVALRGGSYLVGDLLTGTDTTTPIVESGFGFSPKAALLLSHAAAENSVDSVTADDKWSTGAFTSPTERGAQGTTDVDGLATSQTATSLEHDEVYMRISSSDTVADLMDIQSVDSDGFTAIMDNADATQRFVWYLAFGGAARIDVRYDWTGVPSGSAYSLKVKGYRLDEDVSVQVLTPPSTWNTRITITATTNTLYTYALTSSEYNAGSPSIRFRDVSSDQTKSDLWIDLAVIVTTSYWDRIILMRSSDTSGSTWGSQIVLASGRSADSPLLYTYDSSEPSIALDKSGYLHVVWVSAGSTGDQSTFDRVRYTKTTVAYPTQSELANAANWEAVTVVDDTNPGFMPTVSTDTNDAPHIAWSGSKTSGTVYYKSRAAAGTIVRTQSVTGDSGTSTVTSLSLSITAPASGSLIITSVAMDKNSGTITIPTGFTLLNDIVATDRSGGFAFKVSDGTETSVQWTWVTAQYSNMWVGVYTGLSATPFDVKAEADSGTTAVTSQTSGTTGATAQADELAVAVMVADTFSNVDLTRAWSNSFAEFAFVGGPSGFGTPGLSVADKILAATGTVETTFSTTDTGDQMWATVATFKASSTGPWRATVSWGTTYTGLSVDVSPQNNYVSLARYWEHPAGVAPDATIGYRSNTGTNGVNSLKIRTLEGSSWSAEMEEATAGSPIREVRSAYSPLADQRIFVTVSDDGWLDAYVCTPTCTVTNNIGQVWSAAPSVVSQRFDIAYEYLSGDALLVYGVLSTNTARDLAYRTYSGGSWGAEQYIDDTGHATDLEYSGVQLVSKKASDQIGLVGRDETDDDTNAWIWDGSAWGNFVEITPTSASGADRISYAIAWESNSGDLIALARDSPTNNVFSREFTTSWSAVSQILCGDSGYLFSLKPNSVDNDMLLVNVHTSGQSLGTCYWTGSAWANGMTHDAAIDGTVTRSADFAWESTGSKGLLVYGTTPGQITYRTFTAPNTWGAVTNVAMGSNAHAWVQLRTNPTPPSGGVKVLGVVLEETANDLGAITWDGSTFTVVGPSTFSADTGTTTFESFELNYRVAPRTNEIQYLVCKDLATSGCDTSTEFTKWDGTAGYDIVASDAESGSYPSLATTWNANADLWVAYAKDVDGTTRAIYARFLDYPSGGWAAAETVDSLASTLFTRPSIGVDRNADVYALYVATSGPQLYYKARTGGSWGSRTAVDTTSDNPTLIVRAPDHAAYASPGGLYWKSSTSETYFYYIPEFETLVLPVILSILVVWGWRRKGRRRTGDAEPESWTEPNGVPPSL